MTEGICGQSAEERTEKELSDRRLGKLHNEELH
jgi:hypothetical protein